MAYDLTEQNNHQYLAEINDLDSKIYITNIKTVRAEGEFHGCE